MLERDASKFRIAMSVSGVLAFSSLIRWHQKCVITLKNTCKRKYYRNKQDYDDCFVDKQGMDWLGRQTVAFD